MQQSFSPSLVKGEKVINLKRHGFLAVAYAFEKYVEAELKKSRYRPYA